MTQKPPPLPDREPHDAEARALAERLSRLGPHGEPSPALDSRILSAAHAAAARKTATSTPGFAARLRWPVGLGLAASLVLAIGLAWQLRPLPDAAPVFRSEADMATRSKLPSAAAVAESGQRAAQPIARNEAEAPETDVAPATVEQRRLEPPHAIAPVAEAFPAQTDQIRARAVPLPPPAPPAPPAPRSPVVADAPAPIGPTAMPAYSKPAPADAAAAMSNPPGEHKQADTSVLDKASADTAGETAGFRTAAGNSAPATQLGTVMVPEARKSPVQPQAGTQATTRTASENSLRDARNRSEDMNDDMPDEDIPPATVASPVVRDAWLARIRELMHEGRIEDARASLHEFRLRYPHYPLADDLRTLEPPNAPKPVSSGPAIDDAPDP